MCNISYFKTFCGLDNNKTSSSAPSSNNFIFLCHVNATQLMLNNCLITKGMKMKFPLNFFLRLTLWLLTVPDNMLGTQKHLHQYIRIFQHFKTLNINKRFYIHTYKNHSHLYLYQISPWQKKSSQDEDKVLQHCINSMNKTFWLGDFCAHPPTPQFKKKMKNWHSNLQFLENVHEICKYIFHLHFSAYSIVSTVVFPCPLVPFSQIFSHTRGCTGL